MTTLDDVLPQANQGQKYRVDVTLRFARLVMRWANSRYEQAIHAHVMQLNADKTKGKLGLKLRLNKFSGLVAQAAKMACYKESLLREYGHKYNLGIFSFAIDGETVAVEDETNAMGSTIRHEFPCGQRGQTVEIDVWRETVRITRAADHHFTIGYETNNIMLGKVQISMEVRTKVNTVFTE